MPIAVRCGSCAKRFRAGDKLAGKKVKCPECGGVLTIPAPSQPADDDSSGYKVAGEQRAGSRPSGEAGASAAGVSGAGAVAASPQRKCPSCGEPLSAEAVLCVGCGYDLRIGKKRAVSSVPASPGDTAEEEPEPESTLSKAAASAKSYLLGCVLSLVGALIGAGIWYGVAMLTEHEWGIIVWGVGILAGLGMVVGGGRENDMSGITAAFIAIVGIIAAKWLIFANVLLPIVRLAQELAPEEIPSTAKLFFKTCFDPIDGVFMLIAFFTAYGVGSGKSSAD